MEKKNAKTISYRLSFMPNLLSKQVVKPAYGIHKTKNTNCYTCSLKYINSKNDLLKYKCLCYNKNYQKSFDEELKERFDNTDKFLSHNIYKFILSL